MYMCAGRCDVVLIVHIINAVKTPHLSLLKDILNTQFDYRVGTYVEQYQGRGSLKYTQIKDSSRYSRS